MGAACVVKYQSIYKGASKILLDSPFHNLEQAFATKASEIINLPTFFVKAGLKLLENEISNKLKFNLKDMKTQNYMNFNTPIIYIVNPDDPLSGQSTQILYEKTIGPKQIVKTDTSHSDER